MTVLVDNQMTLLITWLEPHVNVIPFEGRTASIEGASALRERIIVSNATALIVRSTTIVNASLLQGTAVRFVATATAGTDHVDTNYLSAQNIAFASAPGSNANAVADYVMLAIDVWLKGRDHVTQESPAPTLGIVGYGNVGRRLAYHARLAGLHVLVYDPPLMESAPPIDAAAAVVSDLRSLIASSDIVSLHVPLTLSGKYATANMIDASHIAAIKTGTLFVNTSRGGIVGEAALQRRLKTREIESVLDVYNDEPAIDAELAACALIATPHIAGYTLEAKVNMARAAGIALLHWLGVPDEGFVRALDGRLEDLRNSMRGNSLAPNQVRDLAEDTQWMREALRNKVPAEVFDSLRKSYVLKRERFRDPFTDN